MGKSKDEKKEKKEKKEKEVKASTDKVSKKEKKDKSSKSDKKDKKIKKEVVERLYDELTGKKEESKDVEVKDASDSEGEKETPVVSQVELLPFAAPLLDGKLEKKVLKLIRKGTYRLNCSFSSPPNPANSIPTGAKARLLRRGVKEVVKHVRKLPTTSKPSALSKYPQGFVVLAADISPMDVISHIPVLCEDHEVPYVFIRSRAELGKAAGTKRLTSAVACVPGGKKGSEDEKEFMEIYEKAFEEVREADRKVPV